MNMGLLNKNKSGKADTMVDLDISTKNTFQDNLQNVNDLVKTIGGVMELLGVVVAFVKKVSDD
jgi:hypothetical protein